MNSADQYRRNAANCKAQAEQTFDPKVKEEWLKLAEAWLSMVEAAQSRPDAFDAK